MFRNVPLFSLVLVLKRMSNFNLFYFQCDECGRQFKHECTFKYHKATHGNVRTKKCPICGVEMRINSQLKRHMMTHTGEKPHACPVCDRKFACLYNMKVHLKSHDGIKPVRKKHQCNICLKEFPRIVKHPSRSGARNCC